MRAILLPLLLLVPLALAGCTDADESADDAGDGNGGGGGGAATDIQEITVTEPEGNETSDANQTNETSI